MAKTSMQKGKAGLVALGVVALVLGILGFFGGIAMVIAGILMCVFNGGNIALLVVGIILIVFGAIAFIVAIPLTIFAIWSLWLAKRTVATNGSIADEIEGKGTVNMLKCQNCGTGVEPNMLMCPNCGKSLSTTKICPNCGSSNLASSKMCTTCGKELK